MAGWRPKNAEGKVLEGGLWVPEEMVQQEDEQRTPSLSSSGRPRGVDWTPGELVAGGPSKKRVEAEAERQAKQNAGPKEGEASKSGELQGKAEPKAKREGSKSEGLQDKVDSILGLLQGNVGGLVNQGRGGVPGASQSPQLQAASNTADQNYNMLTNMLKPHPDQARGEATGAARGAAIVAPKRDLSAEADKILADQEGYYSAIGKRADEQRAKAEEDRRQRERKDPMAYLGVLQGLLGKK